MDSASQLAEETKTTSTTTTTGNEDDKCSQASSAASPIATESSQTSAPPSTAGIASTTTTIATATTSSSSAPTSTASTTDESIAATATSSIDEINEANHITQTSTQVTTTTSTPSSSSTSCSFLTKTSCSSLSIPTQNGDRIKSEEIKENSDNSKDTEKSGTIEDGRVEFKSKQNEGDRESDEGGGRCQHADSQTTQETNSCETESKSSGDREGLASPYPPVSPEGPEIGKEQLKIGASQTTANEGNIQASSTSSNNTNYKSNCPSPESSGHVSNPQECLVPVTMEVPSSTSPSSSTITTSSSSAIVNTNSLDTFKPESTKDENGSKNETLSSAIDGRRPSVNRSEINTSPEPPSSSISSSMETNLNSEKNDRLDVSCSNIVGKEYATAVTSANSNEEAAKKNCLKYVTEDSKLDRSSKYEINPVRRPSSASETAALEVATTTFTNRRLSDNFKRLEATTSTSSSSAGCSIPKEKPANHGMCNYSKMDALIESKVKEPQNSDRMNMSHNSRQETRSADCTSSSSSVGCSFENKEIIANEFKRISPKCSDAVDSSTELKTIPRIPEPVTTAVIASSNLMGHSSLETRKEPVNPLTTPNTMTNFKANRRPSGSIEHNQEVKSSSQQTADNRWTLSSNPPKDAQSIPYKSIETTEPVETEAVSSTDFSLKPSSIEMRRPSFVDERRQESKTPTDAADSNSSDIITYHTSNQAIVASTIRHLFQKSALEEGKGEPKPRIPGPLSIHPNSQSVSHSSMPVQESVRNMSAVSRNTSQNYHPYDKPLQSTQQTSQQPSPKQQELPRHPSKVLPNTPVESVGSSNTSSNYYNHLKGGSSENWSNSRPTSSNNSKISSTSHTYPNSSHPETSSSTKSYASLENIPRIPAMVDTALALKKPKAEAERRYNAAHQSRPDIHQQQAYMPPESSRLQPPTQSFPSANVHHEPLAKRNSMYIENPDFTKLSQSQHKPTIVAANPHQAANLSQLHMKPPDFSKVKEVKGKSDGQKYNNPPVTPENFAELSKKFNYVSDLRLKNAPTHEEAMQENAAYSNLYMKAPQFSMQKFQNKIAETPATNINHSKIMESRCNKIEPEQVLTKRFPQLSDDVVMSVVPTKPTHQVASSSTHPVAEKKKCEYYEQQACQNKPQMPSSYPNNVHLQQREHTVTNQPQHQPPMRLVENNMVDPREYSPSYSQQQRHEMAQISVASYQQRQNHPSYNYPMQHQQPVPQQQHHPPYQQMPMQQIPAAATSVIQSNRPKERVLEYPQAKPQERSVSSPNYYRYSPQQQHYQQQLQQQHHQYQLPQQSPHQGSSPSYNKTTSPLPIMAAKQCPTQSSIIQHNPSPGNPNSNGSSSKSIPSPGGMNPPCGWPSQSPNSRVGHSPVASPHTPYRISQSPVGMNAPSPQSPSFVQPSPSPTYIPRPVPTQTQNTPSVNYKNPYMYPPQPEPHRSGKSQSYVVGPPLLEKSQMERQYPETPKQTYKHEQPPLLPSEYMLSQLPAKVNPPKPPDRIENVYPLKPVEPPKNLNSNFGKPNNNKPHEKPNYREMINNAYALRSATSEEDLNYQIIKRTLNKDISIRRSENDLSKSIFDTMPGPSKSSSSTLHMSRSSESLCTSRYPEPEMKYQYNPEYNTARRYMPNVAGPANHIQPANTVKPQMDSKVPTLPVCSDLTRNDISVTVSKVVKPQPERPKSIETEIAPAPMRTNYVDNKELSTVVISKMKTPQIAEPRNTFTSRTRPPEPPPPVIQKTAPFPSTPAKRESPLDLSVKTVKTKADSTGVDDSTCSTRGNVTNNLKVDFAPNFSKHVRNMTHPEQPPIPPPVSQEMPHRSSYPGSGSSRAYPQEALQATSQTQKVQTAAQSKDIYSSSNFMPQRHKPTEPLPAQYHPNQQVDQKAYSVVHQPMANHHDVRAIHPSMNHTVSAPKYGEKLPDERQKMIEAEQARKMQAYSAVKEIQYDPYTKKQIPPQQPFEKYPTQPQGLQMPYKDQSYVEATPVRYRPEVYPGSHIPPVEPHRNEPYVRRLENAQQTNSNAQPPNREPPPSRPYSNVEMCEKRLESTKVVAPNEPRKSGGSYTTEPIAGKKRPIEPLPTSVGGASQYHPPEKQVRVDELYRAHLAQTQMAQHQHQLQQHHQHLQHQHEQQMAHYHQQQRQHQEQIAQYHSNAAQMQNHYERRDMSAPRKDVIQASTSHYESQQQYYGHVFKPHQPTEPSYPPPPANKATPESHPHYQSNATTRDHAIPYSHSISADRSQSHATHGILQQRPSQAAYAMPPRHTAPITSQPLESNAYPPAQHSYQPTHNVPMSVRQNPTAHSSTPPNSHPRQSPIQNLEVSQKKPPYREAPATHLNASSAQIKYPAEEMRSRQLQIEAKAQPQNTSAPASGPYPPKVGSDHHSAKREMYPSPIIHTPATSNLTSHRQDHRHHYPENFLHAEYPPTNGPVAYPPLANRNRSDHHATLPQSNQTWYPPVPSQADAKKRETARESSPATISAQKPSSSLQGSVYNGENTIRSILPINNRAQIPDVPSMGSQQNPPVNPPQHRGADQNVIDKLRTSIEMRGYEKQKSLNRKLLNGEIPEEEAPKPDIASLLAARIRTKGELKGYTPIPPVESKPVSEIKVEEPKEVPVEPPVPSPTPTPPRMEPVVGEEPTQSAFNLMDWGSTCNDFVEQLQTGVKKRAGKKRKAQIFLSDSTEDLIMNKVEVKEDLPGVAYNGDIDQSLVEQIKSETLEAEASAAESKIENTSQQNHSSSDEDKPLHLLRQQSLTDIGKISSDRESGTQSRPVTKQPKKDEETDDLKTRASQSPAQGSDADSEKIAARRAREKQRLKQEKRLAARLSKTSSSESEDESKRSTQRPKKLTRKARSRASGASTTRDTSDSSDTEEKKRNIFRERLETRKRKLAAEKVSSSSEPHENKKLITKANIIVGDDDRKIMLPIPITPSSVVLRREIITKAQIKCMRPPSEKSDISADEDDVPKKTQEVKNESVKQRNDNSEEESNANAEDSSTATSKSRPITRKAKLLEPPKIEETMTRSKRKKELEEQLANSKILRNEKVIKNTPVKLDKTVQNTPIKLDKVVQSTPLKVKSKSSEKTSVDKTPGRVTRLAEQKSSEEKVKLQINTRRSKSEKVEDAKRKLCGNESDDKARKKANKVVKDESSLSSSEGSSDNEPKTVSRRVILRRSRLSNDHTATEKVVEPRKTRSTDRSKTDNEKKPPIPQKAPTPSKKQVTPGKNRPTPAENNTDKFPPGWELEVYQYKRALKVPQSLITIKGPAHHRVSTSLPDLDPHSSDASESFSENVKASKQNKAAKDDRSTNEVKGQKKMQKAANQEDEASNDVHQSLEGKSIIDILHQRVPFSRRLKDNKKLTKIGRNEPRILPRGTNKIEMLPTPKTNTNIFRGENHHIREIFGGEDRPASAPPELTDSKEDTESRMTFAKKYEQYLAAMNDVEFANKIRKAKKIPIEIPVEETSRSSALDTPIKKEKLDEFVVNQDDDETQDTEINACLQNALELKTEPADTHERDTPSIISEQGDGLVTPLLLKRKKGNKIRSSRRKGSSGFDYIRKKKKPTPNTGNGQEVIKKKRNSPVELLNTRDENDISKEIQKWVLNKGVGQSALHKAARLGYIDVIAYCLERMGLNPDPKDNAGYTPLHEACSKGRLDIARLLLQYGANHSEVAASGIRPLHEASENGYIEVARLLLAYGADPLVTTYSGQTPLMLAESNEMEQFIKNHLQDVQNTGPHKQPWKFPGPWYIYDPDTCGFDVLDGAPDVNDEDEDVADESQNNKSVNSDVINREELTAGQDATKDNKCDTNSNSILSTYDERNRASMENASFKNKLKTNCAVVLNNIDAIERLSTVKHFKDFHSKNLQRRRSTNEGRDERTKVEDDTDVDCEMFEFEESEIPLPPLYLLKDEGSEKWVMLSDLCSLLKVKSKDTLLKQISPALPPPTTNKELLRELKMSDFLEKATCLQLLCAGEKLNIRSSKVVLVKYNESVRNLLGVKTILMKF